MLATDRFSKHISPIIACQIIPSNAKQVNQLFTDFLDNIFWDFIYRIWFMRKQPF